MSARVRSLGEFSGATLWERLRRAAEDLEQHLGTTLLIPPGDYHLCPPFARRLRRSLMSGQLGDDPETVIFTPYYPYETALPVHGARECVIEASGARFILHGPMQAVELSGCENVSLRGLTVEQSPKPYTVARVVGQGADYADLRLPKGCGVTGRTPAPRIVPIDEAGRFLPGCMTSFSRVRLDRNTIRYFGSPALPACTGRSAVLIHSYHYRPAVYLEYSKNVALEQVTLHAQYGMGLLAYRCRDVACKKFAVRPSAGQPVSVNTDASHFSACDGQILLEDCFFSSSEDDAVNVHSYYYDPEPLEGAWALLRVKAPTFTHPQVIDAPLPGSRLELYDPDSLCLTDSFRVLESVPDRTRLAARVLLDRPLLHPGLLLDAGLRPRLVVRRCTFENILTRCLLIKAHTAVVEDCLFRDCPGTTVHIAPETAWREGGAAKDVCIKNCSFSHVGFGEYGIHKNASVLCVEGGCPRPARAVIGQVSLLRCSVSGCPSFRPQVSLSSLGRFIKTTARLPE